MRVSFFGDSQGMTLLINKPNGLQNALTLSDSTVEGCGVLLGTIHSQTGYSRDLSSDCGSWPQQWTTNAAKNNPQIAVIEIGAWDVFDDTLNGQTMKFGSPAWDAYFSQADGQGHQDPHQLRRAGRADGGALLPPDRRRRLAAAA